MNNKVISYTKDERRIIYLQAIPMNSKEFSEEYKRFRKKKSRAADRNLFEIQHRLRVKVIIYGCFFHTYHPDMDFTIAEQAGWIKES